MLLPLLGRWAEVRLQVAAVPVPPGATGAERQVQGFLRFDDWPDFAVRCVSGQPFEEVDRFYSEQLAAGGWQEEETGRREFSPVQHYGIERIRTRRFVRGRQVIAVEVTQAPRETLVSVEPVDEPFGLPW